MQSLVYLFHYQIYSIFNKREKNSTCLTNTETRCQMVPDASLLSSQHIRIHLAFLSNFAIRATEKYLYDALMQYTVPFKFFFGFIAQAYCWVLSLRRNLQSMQFSSKFVLPEGFCFPNMAIFMLFSPKKEGIKPFPFSEKIALPTCTIYILLRGKNNTLY